MSNRLTFSNESPPLTVDLNLRDVARGDELAVALLWDLYFPRLVRFFASWYRGRPRPVVDEEDLALDVFERTWQLLAVGRLSSNLSREAFERLLFTAAHRRLLSQRRFDRRLKRDSGRSQPLVRCLNDLLSSPSVHEAIIDSCDHIECLKSRVSEEVLRNLLDLCVEGNEISNIAEQVNCAPCTVRRRLQRMRTRWAGDLCLHG